MQCLSEIKNKKILLIVAHPDDETLWFFQSIQQLKIKNDIKVFCLTYSAVSKRGKELDKVAKKLGVKVMFGNCEDTGIGRLLKQGELRQAYLNVFSKYKFNLAITHPPHGGEKPHPHHIQLYRMTIEFCQCHSVQFGFFSEQNLLAQSLKGYNYSFNIKKKIYVLHQLFQSYQLLSEEKKRVPFLVKTLISIVCNFKMYRGFEATVNVEEKQSALGYFESQQEVLKSYNSFYKKSEFLFLGRDLTIAK